MLADADPLLLAAAALFAVLNGVNDGGTLLAVGLKLPGLQLLVSMVALAVAVGAVPVVLGTAVASTLATQLGDFGGLAGQRGALVAVLAASVVTLGLSRAGLPTSLTLALVGGLSGAAAGAGLSVTWASVGLVLLLAAGAPAASGGLAYLLSRTAQHVTVPGGTRRSLIVLHRLGFTALALAYGANDGQKMLAVAAIGLGLAPTGGLPAPPLVLAVLALLFLVGSSIGVRRHAGTVGGVVPMRPPNAVIGETAAAAAVLSTAALGSPVSMTQAVAGGLVGTGVSEGYRRVRWKIAANVVGAWMVTLPASFALAAAVAAMLLR